MESTKTRILKKLLETDGYLSGQELCEQLGVSRTAVWKYMKQLKEEGYEIEAIQNKGYCLKDVPDVLGESEIKSRLHTRWAGQTLYYYDEIDSTIPRSSGWQRKMRPMEPLRWRIIRVEEKGGVDEPGILLTEVLLYVNPVSPGDPAGSGFDADPGDRTFRDPGDPE